MENLYIFGAGATTARMIAFINRHHMFNIKGLIVEKQYYTEEAFLGYKVFLLEDIDKYVDKVNDYIFVALYWDRLMLHRIKWFNYFEKNGYMLANIISPLASVYTDAIGKNCWIHDFCIIENDVVLESNVFIAGKVLVGHGTYIGAHTQVEAGSTIGGDCKIDERVFVGLNALLFDNVSVGRNSIIGAGTVIKRSLPEGSLAKLENKGISIKQYDINYIETKLIFEKKIR